MQTVNLRLATLALGLLFTFGFSGCEDKQAQSQIEALKSAQSDFTKRLQALEAENKTLSTEVSQSKQLLSRFTEAIQAQNTAIEQINNAIKDLDSKLHAKPAEIKQKPSAVKIHRRNQH